LLCDDCCRDFPHLPHPICQLCGQPTAAPGLCRSCRHTPLAIDGIRSAFLFEGGVRQAIHELKYRHHQALAVILASLMAAHWRANPLPADVLVAVPLHPARLRERGYNQAELLGRALGGMIGMPVMTGGLRRVRHTQPQMSLDSAHRRGNVQDAFIYQPPASGHGNAVEGRRVLVVDDVCTTGSTLEACSLALKAAGAAGVWGFTLAHA
jgi:ComF family protein